MIETLLIWLAEPVVASLAKWAIGATVTYFVAKPLVDRFGSTPEKRANNLGITAEEAIAYANKNRKDKHKMAKEKADERNEELKKENDQLKADLNKLEQRKLKEQEDWKNETDPSEKAKKFAIMQVTEAEMKDKRKQLKDNEQEIKKNDKEVLAMFDELSAGAEKLSVAKLQAKNSRPDLGYWSTWIILAIAVIVAVLAVKFIFGLFKKLGKEI